MPTAKGANVLRKPPASRRNGAEARKLTARGRTKMVTSLFKKVTALFEGNAKQADRWMQTSQPSLGGKRPIDVAVTPGGVRRVEDIVGRLEHGVYT